jgi:hypothetical protein
LAAPDSDLPTAEQPYHKFYVALQAVIDISRSSGYLDEGISALLAGFMPYNPSHKIDKGREEAQPIPPHVIATLREKMEQLERAIAHAQSLAALQRHNRDLSSFFATHSGVLLKAKTSEVRHLCMKSFVLLGLTGLSEMAAKGSLDDQVEFVRAVQMDAAVSSEE